MTDRIIQEHIEPLCVEAGRGMGFAPIPFNASAASLTISTSKAQTPIDRSPALGLTRTLPLASFTYEEPE